MQPGVNLFHDRRIEAASLAALAVLVLVGQWRVAMHDADTSVMIVRRPRGVMGTDCVLAAVAARRDIDTAEAALDAAEATLRRVEARMSNWLDESEISQLRVAAADVEVPLSRETLDVLAAAREALAATGGAFDITCRPLVELWRRAEQAGERPRAEAVAQARAASSWKDLELTGSGVVKRTASASVDLGGIAKGYGIDRALQTMRDFGLRGGLVDVGGDLACFGQQPGGQPWLVGVKNPEVPGTVAQLRVNDRAVATSGDYARYFEIEGKRYSHIIDPRNGWPAETARSVTVVADTAIVADVWATALCVLGAEALERLPDGVEALVICAGDDDRRIVGTPGFPTLLAERFRKTLPAVSSDQDQVGRTLPSETTAK